MRKPVGVRKPTLPNNLHGKSVIPFPSPGDLLSTSGSSCTTTPQTRVLDTKEPGNATTATKPLGLLSTTAPSVGTDRASITDATAHRNPGRKATTRWAQYPTPLRVGLLLPQMPRAGLNARVGDPASGEGAMVMGTAGGTFSAAQDAETLLSTSPLVPESSTTTTATGR